jgi:hypothetical protein
VLHAAVASTSPPFILDRRERHVKKDYM